MNDASKYLVACEVGNPRLLPGKVRFLDQPHGSGRYQPLPIDPHADSLHYNEYGVESRIQLREGRLAGGFVAELAVPPSLASRAISGPRKSFPLLSWRVSAAKSKSPWEYLAGFEPFGLQKPFRIKPSESYPGRHLPADSTDEALLCCQFERD